VMFSIQDQCSMGISEKKFKKLMAFGPYNNQVHSSLSLASLPSDFVCSMH
jgi:hypothetical protein